MSPPTVANKHSVTYILKRRYLDILRSVQPTLKWKVLVVDSKSVKLIGAVCKMFEITEENVTLVENIEQRRQPFPNLEAVYILTPSNNSVAGFLEDFTEKGNMYAAAHLFFTDALHEGLFKMITASKAANYIRAFQEINVNFYALESRVFSLERPSSFFGFFGFEKDDLQKELVVTAKQMISVFATLNENPFIRYYFPSKQADSSNKTTYAARLAQAVQTELDAYCALNPTFPIPADPPRPRAIMYILDRTVDMFTPLLHEFTYQAMVNDLLNIDHGKYKQEFTNAEGATEVKEHVLDEEDPVWLESRHHHIAETSGKLVANFNKLINSNKALALKGKKADLNDMKDILADLPHFQEMKAKYSLHMAIAQECMTIFEEKSLSSIGMIEQDISCGETPEHESNKIALEEAVPIWANKDVDAENRLRLFLIFLVSKCGLRHDDMKKLLEHCKFSQEDMEILANFEQFGTPIYKTQGQGRSKEIKKTRIERFKRKPEDGDSQFELSRYIPQVKRIVEAHIKGRVENEAFPYVKEVARSEDLEPNKTASKSLRSTKPTWTKPPSSSSTSHKQTLRQTPEDPRIIIFMVGGMTFSEMRCVYEVAAKHHRDVIIGSTHTLTPKQFLSDIRKLKEGPPPPPKESDYVPIPRDFGHAPVAVEQPKDFKSAMRDGDWKSVGDTLNRKIDKMSDKVDKWF